MVISLTVLEKWPPQPSYLLFAGWHSVSSFQNTSTPSDSFSNLDIAQSSADLTPLSKHPHFIETLMRMTRGDDPQLTLLKYSRGKITFKLSPKYQAHLNSISALEGIKSKVTIRVGPKPKSNAVRATKVTFLVPDYESISSLSLMPSRDAQNARKDQSQDDSDSDFEDSPTITRNRFKLSEMVRHIRAAEARLEDCRETRQSLPSAPAAKPRRFTIRLSSLINVMGVSSHFLLGV